MVDFTYLYKGLCGLARAHRANGMAGHLGAAVIAGYFVGEDHHDLDELVSAAIEKELEQIIHGGESLWFDSKKVGITIPELFAPFPQERPQEETISTIAVALDGNIDQTRQSGHNVIFAAIAIRALQDHPEFATPSIVNGVRRLVTGFNGEVPGRGYYGKQAGWITGNEVTLPTHTDFPDYRDEEGMVAVAIDELIQTASVRRRGFGGLFHIINHAAALVELSRFGHQDLARKGLAAHHDHMRLWRSLPDVEGEFGALKPAAHDPLTPEYWAHSSTSQWSAHLTHRIKTLYGLYTLLPLVRDGEKRKKAIEQFQYLMA